jgi:hypothetical protein
MITDYYAAYLPSAADQQTDLPVHSEGKKAHLAGQFGGNNIFRRNVPAIKFLYLLDLGGAKSRYISKNLVDCYLPPVFAAVSKFALDHLAAIQMLRVNPTAVLIS